jgi:hypothetical protein
VAWLGTVGRRPQDARPQEAEAPFHLELPAPELDSELGGGRDLEDISMVENSEPELDLPPPASSTSCAEVALIGAEARSRTAGGRWRGPRRRPRA